jgi:predicted transcriptional regulator
MKVKDALHKGVDWVGPETPVTELAKLMREHDIGAIPIGEDDRLIGMVTDATSSCMHPLRTVEVRGPKIKQGFEVRGRKI